MDCRHQPVSQTKLKNSIDRHLPHHNVYVRLARSKIHGVGVKAIRTIKRGTYIFSGDAVPVVWISQTSVKNLPRELARLYKDFAILRKGKYGCPPSFNLLTPAWYLNCSRRPNVGCDENYDFYALKDIKRGTELTVDYRFLLGRRASLRRMVYRSENAEFAGPQHAV